MPRPGRRASIRAASARVKPGGTWLISASTAPGRRCGTAASISRRTAEVSLPLAVVRRHVARDDDQRAVRERGGVGGERIRSRARANSSAQAGLVHRQLARARAAPPAPSSRSTPITRAPERRPADARDDAEVGQPQEAGGRPRHALAPRRAAAAAWMVRESQRSFSREVFRAATSCSKCARSRRPGRVGRRGRPRASPRATPLGSLRRRTHELAPAPLGEPVHLQRPAARRSPRCASGSSRPGSCTR